jgi:hypothetical protein
MKLSTERVCANAQKKEKQTMEDSTREFFFVYRTATDDFYRGGEPGTPPEFTKEILDAARYNDRDTAERIITSLARSREDLRKPRALETAQVEISVQFETTHWTALR